MIDNEIQRLLELLGQAGQDNPKVQATVAAAGEDPQWVEPARQMLYAMIYKEGGTPNRPGAFPIIKQLPDGLVPLGPVDNGRLEGPTFSIPRGTPENLQHTGVFGETRYGKSYILMHMARQIMLKGDPVWILDLEDEFSRLIPMVPEPNKPTALMPDHLRINFFQPPPGGWTTIRSWVEIVSLLLRGGTFIKDASQNLFEDSLLRLLKSKGSFSGSGLYPSLAETLCYFQSLRLSGSETRGKGWQETLINRMKMLVNNFEQSCHVTTSDMLELLANRSVIFRLRGKKGIPLQFLTNFLMLWLAAYKEATEMKIHTFIIDEAHRLESDKNRNDIGPSPFESIFETGAKRGIHLVLSDQIISRTAAGVLGNIGCRIVTQLPNPKCIWVAQQSMGLSRAQAKRITELKKREVIVKYSGHPTPFLVKVQELSFPPKPDEMCLEKIAQDFLSEVTWSEYSGEMSESTSPEPTAGDTLKVFIRVAEAVETIKERCEALRMDRGCEGRARRALEAKGYIAEEDTTLGSRKKIYKVTPKGQAWAEEKGVKVKRYRSGAFHEYLLTQTEKRIGSLNTRFKFQRNSDIGREHDIQPDSVLIQPLGIRTIIEICCTNLGYEAETLTRETSIQGVDMVIAVTPNQKTKKALQSALDEWQLGKSGDDRRAPIVVLDAGECLFSKKFDWISVFERP